VGPAIQLVIFGVPVLLALVAYLLPGVRVLRSIAGALCILAAGFLTFLMLSADSDEVMRILGMVVVLSALIIAIRPERKPAPAAGPPARPAPVPPPYGQQGYPSQPQPYQAQQSPTTQPPQQNIPTPPSLQQPQQPQPQQLQQNIPTPPSLQQQPPTQPSPQQSSAHPAAG